MWRQSRIFDKQISSSNGFSNTTGNSTQIKSCTVGVTWHVLEEVYLCNAQQQWYNKLLLYNNDNNDLNHHRHHHNQHLFQKQSHLTIKIQMPAFKYNSAIIFSVLACFILVNERGGGGICFFIIVLFRYALWCVCVERDQGDLMLFLSLFGHTFRTCP